MFEQLSGCTAFALGMMSHFQVTEGVDEKQLYGQSSAKPRHTYLYIRSKQTKISDKQVICVNTKTGWTCIATIVTVTVTYG